MLTPITKIALPPSSCFFPSAAIYIMKQIRCKADIRNPLSLLAHERSRFATCVQIKNSNIQKELSTQSHVS